MFSLPLIAPLNDHSLWLSPQLRPYDTDQHAPPTNPSAPAHHQQPVRRSAQNPGLALRSPLTLLKADEDAIRKRKENIARFGATWLKPPGVAKTLQTETEERAEREEQEDLARREQVLLDLQAQQEVEERRQRMEVEAAAGHVEEDGDGERDLDEEIPDAEDEGLDEEDEEDDEDEDDDDDQGDGEERTEAGDAATAGEITFGDESLLEGSLLEGQDMADEQELELAHQQQQEQRYLQLEEAELTGVAQDQADLGMEVNLDDSVPEAGSYQHTDTELEDEDDSDDEVDDSLTGLAGRASLGRPRQSLPGVDTAVDHGGRGLRAGSDARHSFRTMGTSSLLDSSFLASSPMQGRLRSGNARGARGG